MMYNERFKSFKVQVLLVGIDLNEISEEHRLR